MTQTLACVLPPALPWRGLPLTALDSALAHGLNALQTSPDARHLWLAALTHHQWSRGHACLELTSLTQAPGDLLGWSEEHSQALPSDLAQAASTLPWTQGKGSPLVLLGERLYLRRAFEAEQRIRTALLARADALPLPEAPWSSWLDELFAGLGDDATAIAQQHDQRQACLLGLRHGVTLVSGGPGTGKTTTVARMLALLQRAHMSVMGHQAALSVLLAAPTGKASARLAESMRQAVSKLPEAWRSGLPEQAATLHRLLVDQPGTWSVDVLVIDEVSMVDLELMARVLGALPPHARVILLGDPDQLASVQAGAVLAQLCEAPWLEAQRVQLRHSHRFQADRGIGQWARMVQHGTPAERAQAWSVLPTGWTSAQGQVTQLPELTPFSAAGRTVLQQAFAPWWDHLMQAIGDGQQAVAPEQARALLDSYSQAGVLCALREGPWGVESLNHQIALALGLGTGLWAAGRPVMITRNNPGLGLMNGDIGLCLPHALQNGQVVLRVAFAHESGVRWISPARLDDVESVFAMTVHKSQGSEFGHVLLVLPPLNSPVFTRELIYTGLTRAKERLTWWAPNPKVVLSACDVRVARSGGLGL
ncbi:MAG: exodeoxyribonuclease V subunit alpha [Alphaproteobacteria bacterium]|nr:exodeoxyribonuclease V subunit alpha [Alphaproteobacteria bacterium]